jgi:hypothetical protein
MIPFVGYLIIFIIFGERKLAFNSLYGVLNVVNASLTLGSSLFQSEIKATFNSLYEILNTLIRKL